MSIKQYQENGKTLWKVYVHVRSKTNRKRRLQAYAYRLKSENAALKEEKRLLLELSNKLSRMDALGCSWKELVHLWNVELKSNRLGVLGERTIRGYMSTIYKWTAPWMNRLAAELTRADGRDVIVRMEEEGLTVSYQQRVKNTINKLFDWGVEYNHINTTNRSPMKGLLVKRQEEKAPEILTLEEIKTFLKAAQLTKHEWYPIWAFAVLTGMRNGELYALTWDQVDLQKKIIMVDRSYDTNLKITGPTKGRYWRTVPISNQLENLILDIKKEFKENPVDGAYVLPRIKEWDRGDQAVSLRNFLKSIGIKDVKFHALRACFATQMLASGVSVPVLMKIGGWKRISTMDIYIRLAGVDIRGATECLNFTPDEINYGDNVVSLSERKKT